MHNVHSQPASAVCAISSIALLLCVASPANAFLRWPILWRSDGVAEVAKSQDNCIRNVLAKAKGTVRCAEMSQSASDRASIGILSCIRINALRPDVFSGSCSSASISSCLIHRDSDDNSIITQLDLVRHRINLICKFEYDQENNAKISGAINNLDTQILANSHAQRLISALAKSLTMQHAELLAFQDKMSLTLDGFISSTVNESGWEEARELLNNMRADLRMIRSSEAGIFDAQATAKANANADLFTHLTFDPQGLDEVHSCHKHDAVSDTVVTTWKAVALFCHVYFIWAFVATIPLLSYTLWFVSIDVIISFWGITFSDYDLYVIVSILRLATALTFCRTSRVIFSITRCLNRRKSLPRRVQEDTSAPI
jgi:hypothetical protein